MATRRKQTVLSEFQKEATTETNRLLFERSRYSRFNDFWQAVGMRVKERTGFNIQVVCDIVRSVWKKQKQCGHVKGITVKFNVPRNCRTFETNASLFFVELGLYPRRRVAIPIRKNRNWDRFSNLLSAGWTCKTYGLTPSLEIVAYLSKEETEVVPKGNMLGIDINAKNFAYTVINPEGKMLKQGYLGQQLWPMKVHFAKRRAMLQSLNALKKLKRMRHRQRDYVKTNLGQMVREIILLAKRYRADISVEKLSRFKPKGRRFNRKVMTLPFSLFQMILEDRCFDNGITLNRVDAYHTSKWCSRCGAVGNGHDGGNYSLFRCKQCGLTVNADRKASMAVAVKSLLERSPNAHSGFQISSRRVPVSGLFRASPRIQNQEAVPPLIVERGKPIGFSHG